MPGMMGTDGNCEGGVGVTAVDPVSVEGRLRHFQSITDAALSRLFRAQPLDLGEAYRQAGEHFRWQAEELLASAQIH